jgi:hypothetical protein
VGNVVAQGDSGSIGCRIPAERVVKAARIPHEVNTSDVCLLKAS